MTSFRGNTEMATTRSAKDKDTGLMTVKCYDYDGNLFYQESFANVQEADEAAARAERRMMMARMGTFVDTGVEMTDDELLAELGV